MEGLSATRGPLCEGALEEREGLLQREGPHLGVRGGPGAGCAHLSPGVVMVGAEEVHHHLISAWGRGGRRAGASGDMETAISPRFFSAPQSYQLGFQSCSVLDTGPP